MLTFNPQQSEADNWSVTIQLLMATRSYVKQLACLTNILLLINEHSSVNEQSCISLRWEVLLYFCNQWYQSCRCTNSPPLALRLIIITKLHHFRTNRCLPWDTDVFNTSMEALIKSCLPSHITYRELSFYTGWNHTQCPSQPIGSYNKKNCSEPTCCSTLGGSLRSWTDLVMYIASIPAQYLLLVVLLFCLLAYSERCILTP